MTVIKLTSEVVTPIQMAQRQRYDWSAVAKDAQEAAGQWVKVSQPMNRGYVFQITHGRIRVFRPAGSFEARCQMRDSDGEVELFVRYLGGSNGEQ